MISSGRSVKRDRIDKLDLYCAIPSVEEYLMVDSRKVWACIYRRAPGDAWIAVTRTTLEDQLDLLSIHARLDLGHIDRGIDLKRKRKNVGNWVRAAHARQPLRGTRGGIEAISYCKPAPTSSPPPLDSTTTLSSTSAERTRSEPTDDRRADPP